MAEGTEVNGVMDTLSIASPGAALHVVPLLTEIFHARYRLVFLSRATEIFLLTCVVAAGTVA